MGSKKTILVYLAVGLLMAFSVSGCATAPGQTRIESGAIDEQYRGITNPQIPLHGIAGSGAEGQTSAGQKDLR